MNLSFDTLRQQRDELYQDARSHPDSEADQMVQILLLSALRNQQAGDYYASLGGALAGEHRGYRQARAKHIVERQGVGLGEADGSNQQDAQIGGQPGGGGAGGLKAAGEVREGELGRADAELRLKKVAQMLQNAKAAADSGKEMDAMQIYNKIAEVIGLRPPS